MESLYIGGYILPEIMGPDQEAEREQTSIAMALRAEHKRKIQEAAEAGEIREQGELFLQDVVQGADIQRLAIFPDGLAVALTAYNITEPIVINGERLIFARLESKGDTIECEENSRVVVLKETENNKWELADSPVFQLQDPFYCGIIDGEHVFGGVRVQREKDENGADVLGYRTVFYKFKDSIKDAEVFMTGPDRMKDIRLKQDESGVIHIMSRPQGDVGGKGKIAYHDSENMAEVAEYFEAIGSKSEEGKQMLAAEIIPELCGDDEWVGANELHSLPDGCIGVLCHIAHSVPDPGRRLDKNNRPLELKSYYSAAFIYDPKARKIVQPLEIISTADDFPPVAPKKTDLLSVQFSGGLVRDGKGSAKLYAGIGDVTAGVVTIPDPFWQYEQSHPRSGKS